MAQKQFDFSESAGNNPIAYSDVDTYLKQQDTTKNSYIAKLYKNYYMYRMDREKYLYDDKETRRTNVKFPITHMFVSRIYNLILKSDTYLRIDYKMKEENEELEKKRQRVRQEMQLLFANLWEKEQTQESFFSAILDAINIGRGNVYVNYKHIQTTKEYLDKKGDKKERKELLSYPYLSYRSPFDTYFDPGAKTLDDCRFIIERHLLTANGVRKKLKEYDVEPKSDEINQKNQYILYKDYNSQKYLMPFANVEQNFEGGPRDITEDDQFNIKNKMLEYIEVFSPNHVTIYVGGVDHGTHPTVGPVSGYKQKIIHYKPNPGTMYTLGVGYLCWPIQEVYDIIGNLRIDNVKLAVNKSFLVEQAMNISGNNIRVKIGPGKTFKVESLDQIRELPISEIKESAYREADVMFGIVQAMTGITSGGLGLQQKVERVAAGAELLKDALDDQLLPLLNSISNVMSEVAKEFFVMALELMPEKELNNIIGKDNIFSTLSVDDLLNDYHFSFKMTSQWNKISTAERQQLLSLIQTVAGLQDSSGTPVADVRKMVAKVLDSLGLSDMELESDDVQEQGIARVESEKVIQEAAQPKQQPQNPANLPLDLSGGELPIDDVDAESMRALQGMGGNIPPEMTTNAGGVN